MLVLSRKPQQSLLIGNNIKVMVTQVSGQIVRLGVEAPKDVPIYREELLNKMQEETSN